MKKKIFSDRRIMVLILGIVIVSIMTVTLAYAALSVTLNIAGSARVSAADWDIYLGNQVISEGSVSDSTLNVNGTKATFDATFNMPGDYYEFTIDVINGGDIDAIITKVNKGVLTADESKLFEYTVKYQNGSSINTNQKLDKNSYLRLLVRVDYKNDISNNDLPSSQLTVDFSFDVEFTQSDGVTGDVVSNNGSAGLFFYVDDTPFQYENGMTWEQWFDSEYNSSKTITKMYGYYSFNGGCIRTDSFDNISADDVIDSSISYQSGICGSPE